MSQKRQPGIFARSRHLRCSIVTLRRNYRAGHVIPLHVHRRDQFVYASRGVMTVRTAQGCWIVPPHRAVWIPAGMPHTIAMSGVVEMRTLYVEQRMARKLPRRCCVVNVPPLLRELVLYACAHGDLRRSIPRQRRLTAVVLDLLEAIETIPLQLPTPADPRAVRVMEGITANLSEPLPVSEICRTAGASKRTIERLFQKETGMTIGRWRQQLKLMRGMQLLAEGEKVTRAALDAGYSTPSAFIARFKKMLGTTPKSYFAMNHTKADSARRPQNLAEPSIP